MDGSAKCPTVITYKKPTKANKQLKIKTIIMTTYSDTEDSKKFSHDEKEMTVEELMELVIDH